MGSNLLILGTSEENLPFTLYRFLEHTKYLVILFVIDQVKPFYQLVSLNISKPVPKFAQTFRPDIS